MQIQFEFQTPKYYNFFQETKEKDPSDFSIDLTDPNDYWFMITHVEVSPIKELEESHDDSEEHVQDQNEPVRRTELVQIQPLVKFDIPPEVHLETKIEVKPNPFLKKTSKRITNIIRAPTQVTKQIKQRKSKAASTQIPRLRPKSQKISLDINIKGKESKKQMFHKKQDQLRPKARDTRSLGTKPLSRRTNSKDFRPCPLDPRVQRKWEGKHEKRWCDLSGEQKKQAEESMAKINKQRTSGDHPAKQIKKEQRFRF